MKKQTKQKNFGIKVHLNTVLYPKINRHKLEQLFHRVIITGPSIHPSIFILFWSRAVGAAA